MVRRLLNFGHTKAPNHLETPSSASRAVSSFPAIARARRFDHLVKRALDVSVALAVGLLLTPLLVATVIAIKVTSPGPLFHRRRVVGRGGRPFDAFKFRSMRVDADRIIQDDAALWAAFQTNHKLPHDRRVTPIGRILRRFSIDELPQLLNVLRGEMSLIGPRMVTAAELERYGPHVPTLLSVSPGMTGLWQVSGRQTTSYERRVELDMHYVTHWNLWLDLSILLRTPLVVLRGEGAY